MIAILAQLGPVADRALTLSGSVHAGGVILFALLFAGRTRIPHVRTEDLVRVYRSFGGGFGITLGVAVFAFLALWPAAVNPGAGMPEAFTLRWDTSEMQVESARAVIFFMYWVNYISLEIWTLDDCRLLDRDGVIADRGAYEDATARVGRHLMLNALLLVIALAI